MAAKWSLISMDRCIAALIDRMSQGKSIEDMINPAGRIKEMLSLYRRREEKQ